MSSVDSESAFCKQGFMTAQEFLLINNHVTEKLRFGDLPNRSPSLRDMGCEKKRRFFKMLAF